MPATHLCITLLHLLPCDTTLRRSCPRSRVRSTTSEASRYRKMNSRSSIISETLFRSVASCSNFLNSCINNSQLVKSRKTDASAHFSLDALQRERIGKFPRVISLPRRINCFEDYPNLRLPAISRHPTCVQSIMRNESASRCARQRASCSRRSRSPSARGRSD